MGNKDFIAWLLKVGDGSNVENDNISLALHRYIKIVHSFDGLIHHFQDDITMFQYWITIICKLILFCVPIMPTLTRSTKKYQEDFQVKCWVSTMLIKIKWSLGWTHALFILHNTWLSLIFLDCHWPPWISKSGVLLSLLESRPLNMVCVTYHAQLSQELHNGSWKHTCFWVHVFIPRILLLTSFAELPFQFTWCTFLVQVVFIMIVNKSHGQFLQWMDLIHVCF